MAQRSNKGESEAAKAAVQKYREFHRFDPKQVMAVPDLIIPARVHYVGDATWVTYRSGKVDPGTMQKPGKGKAFDYIHEHNAGVRTYLTAAEADGGELDTAVPHAARDATALVQLGKCLGFSFKDRNGNQREAKGSAPLPDLCCTPDGSCLLVVQDKKKVLAMMWGGGLGVFARGIDG